MWSTNLLTSVVLMFTPQEMVELYLWGLNKNFYKAVKGVVPLQEKSILAEMRYLHSQLAELEGIYQ